MIGIHVVRGYQLYKDDHANVSKSVRDTHFTISYHERYSKPVFFEDENYFLMVDGWVFNEETSYEEQAEYF